MHTKRLVRISLFTAIALILSLVENMMPPLLSFAPGAKLGLSNVVSLIALVILGYSDAYIILFARVLLGAIFGGNISSIMYSLPSGLASLTLELVLYHFCIKQLSLMSISFFGASVHNIVQLSVASLVVGTNLMATLPLMLIASIIAGLFVGICSYLTIKFLPRGVYIDKFTKLRSNKNEL